MSAQSSWQLIVTAMRYTAAQFRQETDTMMSLLEEDGSSRVVNAARFSQMRMVMVAVGGFSMLEGILEQTKGWTAPFRELDQNLREIGEDRIADEFMAFRLATNVLKHGSGNSYERLLRCGALPFRVKSRDENFFDEGDVSEVPGLVLVDEQFVISCARAIENAMTVLRIPRLDI